MFTQFRNTKTMRGGMEEEEAVKKDISVLTQATTNYKANSTPESLKLMGTKYAEMTSYIENITESSTSDLLKTAMNNAASAYSDNSNGSKLPTNDEELKGFLEWVDTDERERVGPGRPALPTDETIKQYENQKAINKARTEELPAEKLREQKTKRIKARIEKINIEPLKTYFLKIVDSEQGSGLDTSGLAALQKAATAIKAILKPAVAPAVAPAEAVAVAELIEADVAKTTTDVTGGEGITGPASGNVPASGAGNTNLGGGSKKRRNKRSSKKRRSIKKRRSSK